jgi:mannitol operon repressor
MSTEDFYSTAALIARYPELKEFFEYSDRYHKESDLGMVIAVCKYLEELLRRILQVAPDAEDRKRAGEVGFGRKIKTVTRAGLITKEEAREVDLLRSVRNRFAHEMHASFTDDDIREWCEKLVYSVKEYEGRPVSLMGQFRSSADSLIVSLNGRPDEVQSGRWFSRSA